MERALARVEQSGDHAAAAFVRAIRGARDLHISRFAAAVDGCLEDANSEDLRSELGASAQSLARAAVMPALYWLGEVGRAADVAETWIASARESGDAHLEVSFRVLGAHRYLRTDDPARALRAIRDARMVDLDYMHPAFRDPWWEASVLLYEGDGEGALAVCERAAPDFRANAFAASRVMWALIAGSASTASAGSGRRRQQAMAELERCVRETRMSTATLAPPIRAQLRGTLAWLRGDRKRALSLIQQAIAHYDALGMRLHAASLRLVAAEGLPAPDATREEALTVFASEGIVAPERWAAMLAPGIGR
jgi:hypothetical protein